MMLTVGLALTLFFLWFLYKSILQSSRLLIQIQQEQQEENRTRLEEIDKGLRDWLKTLEIPILADQTRLEAAAHQLRRVLVERLMNGPDQN